MSDTSLGTVLVVEDQESVRRLMKQVLVFLGYKVLLASTAVEALKICEKHVGEIDVLVADFHLPDMNGVHLANRVNAIKPRTKTLIVSGDDESEIRSAAVATDGLAFLAKPYTPGDLSAKLTEVLASS